MLPTTRTALPLVAVAFALLLPLGARAEDGPPGMAWVDGLEEAFKLAKELDKPVMICVNAKRVDRGRREPAARELRTRTYRDEKVVELSEQFVCAFLTAEGSSADFGELRLRYGIDGDIVSPQHIFAYPNGKLLYREEFWPYGTGQRSIDSLLKMMKDALAKDKARRKAGESGGADGSTTPGEGDAEKPEDGSDDVVVPEDPEVREVPEDPAERETWIQEQLGLITRADERVRRAALTALVDADKDGDIVLRLIELIAEYKKQPIVQAEIIRALGRPGLEIAAKPLGKYLSSREDTVRANTAVTLEYIGSKESLADLRKRASREKVDTIANHMYRAIGRCGVGDAKVRSLLVKKIQGAKSEVASYGPIIGLAYFEKDPKTAKEVQSLLKKWGVPGGRAAFRTALRRALLTWCLTEVGFRNPKAVEFLKDELIPAVPSNRWTGPLIDFYESAAAVCSGDEGAKDDVEQGVRFSINRFNRTGDNPLMDDARRDRDQSQFEPKGEWGAGRSS